VKGSKDAEVLRQLAGGRRQAQLEDLGLSLYSAAGQI
jgi:hypothetical protein